MAKLTKDGLARLISLIKASLSSKMDKTDPTATGTMVVEGAGWFKTGLKVGGDTQDSDEAVSVALMTDIPDIPEANAVDSGKAIVVGTDGSYVLGEAGSSTTVDDTLSADSTNPVQNKVVKAALDDKAATDHSHTEYAVADHTHNNYALTTHSHAEYVTANHNHNASDINAGVLSVAQGGTGNSSVDTAPTSGSSKMVTSGGVYTALTGKSNSDHTHSYAGSSSAGGAAISANKVNNALTIQGNGTSLGTFDGSNATTVNLTYSNVGAAAASHSHNYASSDHTHTAANIYAGTFAGAVVANPSDLTTAQVRNSVATQTDPGAGATSTYPDGTEINVYE